MGYQVGIQGPLTTMSDVTDCVGFFFVGFIAGFDERTGKTRDPG